MLDSLFCLPSNSYNSAKDVSVPLQVHQLVTLVNSSKRVVALKLDFGNFKHSYTASLHRHNSCCPVQLLLDYLSLRGNRPGPLFLNLDNSPFSRAIFAELLSLSLKACGLDSTPYKGHSFRIGAASFAAERGKSDAQITALGRWRSNAY